MFTSVSKFDEASFPTNPRFLAMYDAFSAELSAKIQLDLIAESR